MADVYRETRVYRDEGSDDDDRYRTTTVRRYKVNPGRYERSVVEVDDDRRSRYSGYTGRPTGELLEVDRRSAVPDRPRSAFEPYGEHSRSVYYERDVERESPREPERSRVSVYEARESDRDWDKRSRHSHSHGHHHHHHRHDSDEIRVEKRVEERYEDPHGHEVERYRKETEYYTQADPPPAPVIIRQRAPEPQKIIVQEAPPPAPIIVPRQDPGVVVVRDKEPAREMVRREPSEEEYWYRHERREVGSHRGDHDRDYGAIGRYDPRYRDRDDEDYYHRRTVIRRERSESPHHKRYLAEGALAAAGLTALLAARRDKDGELQENRGRKVLAGAALGALGTEAVRRAHSAYGDRYRDGSESPDRHSILKKGLGVAAVALAAAGAAKYYQTNKVEKEESHRGRSRHRGRYSGDEYSRSPTRSRSRSRRRSLSTVAKAALGTAAAAGVVKKLRDRSKSKGSRHHSSSRSRSRSKSRLRRGAEIAGAAAAAGVATKMWKNHKDKDKKDTRDYSSDEDDYRRRRYSHSRSRSRSRSQARSLRTDATADPELGLVEYGNDPLPANRNRSAQGYESEAEARRERRRRRRDRDRSASLSDPERKRSKSRLRDMAAAGAAAIGIKGMKDRHDQDKRDREATDDDARDRGPRDRGSRDRGSRSRDRDRRRYDEDEDERERFYTDHRDRAHSPPTASGGAYYPPYPDNTPPPAGGASLHTFPDPTNHQNYQPYVPQDYTGYAPPGPPPPGPPPGPAPNSAPTAGFPPPPPGPPPAGGRIPPDHVSDIARSHRSRDGGREDGASSRATRASASLGSLGIVADSPIDGLKPPSQETLSSSDKDRHGGARSVTFIPLSPKSSMTMERHRREQAAAKEAEQSKVQETRKVDDEDEVGSDREQRVVTRPPILRRRSSDPSSDRPLVSRRPARDYDSGVSDSEEDVELLPARFDDYGRPLDGSSTGRNRWSSRHGEFERRPRHPGDWNMRGAWQVSGTEDETVERLARTMTDVLDGRQSWLHLIGGVIGGGLLQPDESHGRHDRSHSRIEDDGDEARQAKHRKRR